MEQRIYWEAGSHTARQEINRFLLKKKFRYAGQNRIMSLNS
jgi:hypothetical protein